MLQNNNYSILEFPVTEVSRDDSTSSLLEQGYTIAEGIIEANSKSFAFASKFLNKNTKKSVVALYAFCRMVDDIVDETNADLHVTNDVLNQLKYTIDQLYYEDASDDPIMLALGDTLRKHNIPSKYVHELIEGVRMDLYKKEYANFRELYLYSYRVASTVGLMMTHIFLENPSKSTLRKAESMGIAMQLTNILRDVKEDYERGRVYLPQDWLKIWNVDETNFAYSSTDETLKNLVEYMSLVARKYYRKGFAGIKDLPPGADFVVELSGQIYSSILDEIKKSRYQILHKRHYVSKMKKILIAAKLRLKFRRRLKTVKVFNSS
ncbi:MAG: phytoene/squalene synthase family protein [Candidatus Kariarchaeaceae archaeon]|jgi:phytoene synthase